MPRETCGEWGSSCPPDKTCHPLYQSYQCPREPCSKIEIYECNDGFQCFASFHQCDRLHLCKGGGGKLGCLEKSYDYTKVVLPVALVSIVIVLTIATVVFLIMRKRRMASQRNARCLVLPPQGGEGYYGKRLLKVEMDEPVYVPPGEQGQVVQQYQPAVPVEAQNSQGYRQVPVMPDASAPPVYDEARYYPQK